MEEKEKERLYAYQNIKISPNFGKITFEILEDTY